MTEQEQLRLKALARMRMAAAKAKSEPEQAERPRPEWSELPGNVGPSAYRIGEGIVNTVMNPIDTLHGMGTLSNGVLNRVLPQSVVDFRNSGFNPLAGFAQSLGLNPADDETSRQVSGAAGQMLKDRYGGVENVRNTMIEDPVGAAFDISTLLTGGAAGLSKIPQAAKAANVAKTAAIATNPITPVAQGVSKLASLRNPVGNVAKPYGVSRTAAKNVSANVGDTKAALAKLDELGPEALLANLTPDTTQAARTVASMPVKNTTNRDAMVQKLMEQLQGSGARASADWDAIVGPEKSRFAKNVETAKTKAGTSNLYELAKGKLIDPKDLMDAIPQVVDKARNNPAARRAINEINRMIIDPRTGKPITDAGELLNVRKRIDEMIPGFAPNTNNPGADLYDMGKRSLGGSILSELRKKAQGTLHQDPDLQAADKVFAGAERASQAFDFGSKRIVGRGDNMIEAPELAAKFAKMTDEEKAAILEGLGRKGQNMIRDVPSNRNDGKAMADAIATQNNLDRLSALGLDSGRAARMAAREDQLAASSNRILGGSDTARTANASQMYPGATPASGTTPTVFGGGLALAGEPITGGAVAGAGLLAKLVQNFGRNKNLSGAAKLLGLKGDEAKAFLQAVEDARAGKMKPSVNNDLMSKIAAFLSVSKENAALPARQ